VDELAAIGVRVSVEELTALPVAVEFSDRLGEQLGQPGEPPPAL
jgi:hypothetical protein